MPETSGATRGQPGPMASLAIRDHPGLSGATKKFHWGYLNIINFECSYHDTSDSWHKPRESTLDLECPLQVPDYFGPQFWTVSVTKSRSWSNVGLAGKNFIKNSRNEFFMNFLGVKLRDKNSCSNAPQQTRWCSFFYSGGSVFGRFLRLHRGTLCIWPKNRKKIWREWVCSATKQKNEYRGVC